MCTLCGSTPPNELFWLDTACRFTVRELKLAIRDELNKEDQTKTAGDAELAQISAQRPSGTN